MEGTILQRIILAAAFGFALIGAGSVSMPAAAAPVPGPAQVSNDTASPIIQIDRRCGPGRHYVGRHRMRGHDGRLHWVAGRCIRNR